MQVATSKLQCSAVRGLKLAMSAFTHRLQLMLALCCLRDASIRPPCSWQPHAGPGRTRAHGPASSLHLLTAFQGLQEAGGRGGHSFKPRV